MKTLIKVVAIAAVAGVSSLNTQVDIADASSAHALVLVQSVNKRHAAQAGRSSTASQPTLSNLLAALSESDQRSLQQGKPLITGDSGNYTARILITATPSQVWAVLTDYSNYAHFMPDMDSSQVLKKMGNQRLFEQVDRYRIALFTFKTRTRLQIIETPQSSYSFRMVEGKLQKLQGNWTIQPISPTSGDLQPQVLVTVTVEAQPRSVTPKGIFYNLFRNHLAASLTAINAEVKRRNS